MDGLSADVQAPLDGVQISNFVTVVRYLIEPPLSYSFTRVPCQRLIRSDIKPFLSPNTYPGVDLHLSILFSLGRAI